MLLTQRLVSSSSPLDRNPPHAPASPQHLRVHGARVERVARDPAGSSPGKLRVEHDVQQLRQRVGGVVAVAALFELRCGGRTRTRTRMYIRVNVTNLSSSNSRYDIRFCVYNFWYLCTISAERDHGERWGNPIIQTL